MLALDFCTSQLNGKRPFLHVAMQAAIKTIADEDKYFSRVSLR